MRRMRAVISGALLLLVGGATPQARAEAPSNCGRYIKCGGNHGGIDTSTSRDQVANLPQAPGDGRTLIDAAYVGPRYEYDTTIACSIQPPGGPAAEALCSVAISSCSNPTKGPGPLTRIWRRTVDPTGAVSGWQQIGVTCWTDVAPGSKPRVTMAMIINAFHNTPWSKAQITTQPAGNVTLVGLDTYYQVNWTPAGFQPDEVDTVDLLGYGVDIRPKLDHFTYLFGDGDTFGPTTYLGGVYPTGTITHQYQVAGSYNTRVDTTFGADFRINGGAWAPIPDTVTVPGPPTTLTVKTAKARLVSH